MDMIRPANNEDRQDCPEVRMWRAALAVFLVDAMKWHQGNVVKFGRTIGDEVAYKDSLSCGYRLKWLCAMAGSDPQYVSERFRRWCARNPKN